MMMWGDPIGAATLNQPINNNNTDNATITNHKRDKTDSQRNNNNNNINPNQNQDLNPKQKKCISSIYQVTGPAHIPTADVRWQELFLSYDILVHLDRGYIHDDDINNTGNGSGNDMTMMDQVCKSMAKHARNSSNLAAFSWHLTKMINELLSSCKECCNYKSEYEQYNGMNTTASQANTNRNERNDGHAVMTQSSISASTLPSASKTTAKIKMVGKARVVCGALNLFRIICHEVITTSFSEMSEQSLPPPSSSPSSSSNSFEFLQEAFTYKSRLKESAGLDINTVGPLMSTILSFISMMGTRESNAKNSTTPRNNPDLPSSAELLKTVPELYDATVFSLMLLNVLFSTQLYQPLLSSFELRDEMYNHYNNNNNNTATTGTTKTTTAGTPSTLHKNFFLDTVMYQAYEIRQRLNTKYEIRDSNSNHTWSSQSILSSILNWMIERPPPPQRSIAAHLKDMIYTVASEVKGEKIGVDGMFENHAIVMARAPVSEGDKGSNSSGEGTSGNGHSNGSSNSGAHSHGSNSGNRYGGQTRRHSAPRVILNATNKVLHLSSSLLLLPFRLMTLALRALGHPENFLLRGGKGSGEGYDDIKLAQLQAAYGARGGSSASMASPTNDVLWISDSPVADFGSTIFLILSNNYRVSSHSDNGDMDGVNLFVKNTFRSDLACLDDNRWDGWDNSYSVNGNGYLEGSNNIFESVDLAGDSRASDENEESNSLLQHSQTSKQKKRLTINFEHLFQSFGDTLHNELGALTLYTLLQSSPIFAASLAVQSGLDMLVLPLLRTLYFSSTVNQHISGRTVTASATTTPSGNKASNSSSSVSVAQNPFRSQSQLYVIMILLLIFSQDSSFGPDSFRRSNIPVVVWYKERKLKNISLGSMIILSLLRCITFNLNRLQDPFLLSNCCAILLNLSPHIVKLHPYASMRLASVLVSSMKRYTVLVMKNGGKPAEEGDVSSLLGMYAETCRILLQVVRHSIRRRVVEKNLHLVYALVYNQRDLKTVLKAKKSPFRPPSTDKITEMIKKADSLITQASARTSEKAMEVLEQSISSLKGSKSSSGKSNRMLASSNASVTDDSTISTTSSSTVSGMEDFRFTYEEEADPEIFFVPYLWEIVVSCVSASTIEWNKKRIKVFALLEYEVMDGSLDETTDDVGNQSTGVYAKDEGDIV